ncbi:MAG TPA: DNA polymerase III subunit epsilon [Burkholderiales bacterium]|nr:DNA polymerase III subunit epsilon [Burkholderiales bacterium]
MRQVILDTETTGLDPTLGHKIIEIAGVEIVDRRLTNNHFHRYVNPERDSEEAALQIHGLTREFLKDKPKFKDVVAEFLDFVRGAELVIHNAAFDIAFIDYELKLLDLEPIQTCCANVVDTFRMARELYPGKRNGLDALCDRHEIDRTARTLHGALLDAQLLADVYLAMTRGQETLLMDNDVVEIRVAAVNMPRITSALTVVQATAEELESHALHLREIDKASSGACVWMQLESTGVLAAEAA